MLNERQIKEELGKQIKKEKQMRESTVIDVITGEYQKKKEIENSFSRNRTKKNCI